MDGLQFTVYTVKDGESLFSFSFKSHSAVRFVARAEVARTASLSTSLFAHHLNEEFSFLNSSIGANFKALGSIKR